MVCMPLSQVGIDLVPIQVTSDGSCLPHAVSRALVGFEIFYDCLRASIGAPLSSCGNHLYIALMTASNDGLHLYYTVNVTPSEGAD